MPRGQTVALLGPNGAGKSTTVAMLLGLTFPDAGEVLVDGRAPRSAMRNGAIAELVGLVHRLYPAPLPVAEALELSGLAAAARRRVDRLSGGQARTSHAILSASRTTRAGSAC